jgi:hypothetical protein
MVDKVEMEEGRKWVVCHRGGDGQEKEFGLEKFLQSPTSTMR